MGLRNSTIAWKWQVIFLFFSYNNSGSSENLQYSVLEEAERGTLVANITDDLSLLTAIMSERRIRLRSSGGGQYFAVDPQSGAFFVNRTIDRESVCGSSLQCSLTVEVMLEKPLELHKVEVEILDINDNSPIFSSTEQVIKITEIFTYSGARFPLEEAQDRDSGVNGVRQYSLSPHMYFSLSTRSSNDGAPSPELVIEKALDREEGGDYHLVLTAFDGGDPPKSGTSQIIIIIIDFNDNAPMFQQTFYKINVTENIPLNTPIIQLNASDLDEGVNAEIEYLLDGRTPVSVRLLFSLDPDTGIIRTNGVLDFESSNFYEITVRAKDKGIPQMEGSCVVQITIKDVNDHVPEILLTSLLGEIPEDTVVGTTIGLFSVLDMDSGKNGDVQLVLSPDRPFQIKSFKDHYALIVSSPLDRENISLSEVVLTAKDMGSPSLSSQVTIAVNISDVNDNPPLFLNQEFNTFIQENNEPGHLLYTLSAFDRDEGNNARFTYSIVEQQLGNLPLSSFISLNPVSGSIYATCSFDYEQINVLEIIVQVKDNGDPRLFTNATLFVFILDMNDNPPKLLHPKLSGELISQLNISKSVPVGYLVTKVSAVDSDSGHNALLSYSFVGPSNDFPFNISTHSGEIKTVRNFLSTDEFQQKIVLSISDRGDPSLSITVTLLVALVNNAENPKTSLSLLYSGNNTDILMYLVISLVAITLAFLVTLMLLMVKCFKKDGHICQYPCWFLNQSNPDNCHGIQQPALHFNMDGTLKYMEVRTDPDNPESHCCRTYFSQGAENINLTILKPFAFSTIGEMVNKAKTIDVNNMRDPSQQGQPNTDWRFTQTQRPGPSGTQQPTEEAGVWPNNQFETERLQAMILASANEAAEGSSAMVGGTGTMGLSARYGPQFTLQHVPDYRQNIYIPGTTSTLTNAAGKRDGKSGAPSGNKKKSGKKEKK
ncbi:protocadherin gamma-C5-like isoform X4 [Hyla sarda]|uniref:protocadherin gamma-C5-like isoform X4 n=1 Tax=Hyla sarda TaxID=327740 RepID=UPI0024C2357B|nr:protocadherin gamma-C5-like isoform X4 [Hyla sarda]